MMKDGCKPSPPRSCHQYTETCLCIIHLVREKEKTFDGPRNRLCFSIIPQLLPNISRNIPRNWEVVGQQMGISGSSKMFVSED